MSASISCSPFLSFSLFFSSNSLLPLLRLSHISRNTADPIKSLSRRCVCAYFFSLIAAQMIDIVWLSYFSTPYRHTNTLKYSHILHKTTFQQYKQCFAAVCPHATSESITFPHTDSHTWPHCLASSHHSCMQACKCHCSTDNCAMTQTDLHNKEPVIKLQRNLSVVCAAALHLHTNTQSQWFALSS